MSFDYGLNNRSGVKAGSWQRVLSRRLQSYGPGLDLLHDMIDQIGVNMETSSEILNAYVLLYTDLESCSLETEEQVSENRRDGRRFSCNLCNQESGGEHC
jgi:hypothetical protein